MKIVHDLPILYFSSDVKDVGGSDFSEIASLDSDAGPIKGETGIEGLRIDFNAGLRLRVPKGNWHICISDDDSEFVFFDESVSEKVLISMEKYYIKWRVEAYLDGELKFAHVFNPEGMNVVFSLKKTPLGEAVMLLPYVQEFVNLHKCHGLILTNPAYEPIIREYFPELEIINSITDDTYANYLIGTVMTPPFLLSDSSRALPVQYVGRFLLGLHRNPQKVLFYPKKPREIETPYVCIAVQASGVAKSWLNPNGWDIVIDYLKQLGYRVLCIDRDRCNEDSKGRKVCMPQGAEDYTGNLPLTDRIELLAYADFFIGVGSGLSWLADAAGCPVILISGFSMPSAEFDTPYRVINPLVCHGCYNDMTVDWLNPLCPRHHDTEREYECSVKIPPKMVISTIDRLRKDLKDRKELSDSETMK